MSKTLRPAGQQLRSVALRYRLTLNEQRGGHKISHARPSATLAAAGQAAVPIADKNPLARDLLLARLEAVLFLAREPLPSRKLAVLGRLADGTEARTLVRRLNRLYDLGGNP